MARAASEAGKLHAPNFQRVAVFLAHFPAGEGSVVCDCDLFIHSPRIAILAKPEVAKAHFAITEKDISRLEISVRHILTREHIGVCWQARRSRVHLLHVDIGGVRVGLRVRVREPGPCRAGRPSSPRPTQLWCGQFRFATTRLTIEDCCQEQKTANLCVKELDARK